LNGLNWHVQVDPLSLSTTSLPDTWVAAGAGVDEVPDADDADDADDLDDELPPQAVTTRHSAPTTMIHLKRCIDTLRSRLHDRRLVAGSELI
jgi:hypothetical protein